MTLSPMDDYPIHQVAEVIRHVGTSDRNFYDRYYFNCYPADASCFLIVGFGQYPNLGVMDCFAVLRRGDDHIVFRASKALGDDRMDLNVGPMRISILDALQRIRVELEPNSQAPDLSFDLTFEAETPATLESRHFHRQLERVTFDTQRFVQAGRWSGSLTVDGTTTPVTPDTWRGNRDRSWGVRPVGEAEPPGRRADPAIAASQNFFWIYSVMRFDEFSVVAIIQEDAHGRRIVEDATRVWVDRDRPAEWLGRPEHDLTFLPGTREISAATLTFDRPGRAQTLIRCDSMLANYIGVGTGYGLEQDWRHGMWQGELEVQGLRRRVSEIEPWMKLLCPVDNLARFTFVDDGRSLTGTGLFEIAVIGPCERYGFAGLNDTR